MTIEEQVREQIAWLRNRAENMLAASTFQRSCAVCFTTQSSLSETLRESYCEEARLLLSISHRMEDSAQVLEDALADHKKGAQR